ncbi:hypothetical protein JGK42_003589 [Aeromonas veronii]|nr:hypothetical protein [Aeromonas veronii]
MPAEKKPLPLSQVRKERGKRQEHKTPKKSNTVQKHTQRKDPDVNGPKIEYICDYRRGDAAFIICQKGLKEIHYYANIELPETSKPQIDLFALSHAIEIAATLINQHGSVGTSPIKIYSSSEYATNCINQWHKGWVANGWHTKSGTPVRHRVVIEALILRHQPYADMIEVVFTNSIPTSSKKLNRILVEGRKPQKSLADVPKLPVTTSNDPSNTVVEGEVQGHPSDLTIYCDGACDGNPGPSGCGVVVYERGKIIAQWYGGYQLHGTNNIGELMALNFALSLAQTYLTEHPATGLIRILTDSTYTRDCATKWAPGWKKRGWKLKSGKQVGNRVLVEEVYSAFERIKNKVSIEHVRGHAGIEGNELADKLASLAITANEAEFARLNDDL